MTFPVTFIEGRSLILRPLLDSDFSLDYLGWLNDPEVNAGSQRRAGPTSWSGMRGHFEHYDQNPDQGFVLAMVTRAEGTFIGTVSLVNIQSTNRCAEIGILVGDRSYWRGGYGTEALYLVSRHGFHSRNLHRIFAGTFNPAFARCCEKLGWAQEGRWRDAVWSDGRYVDIDWYGILAPDFVQREEYEPAPSA